ncbi:MAG: hypothetical protein AB7Q81_02715 [Gammaproteobacteria bacterium]
MAAFFAAMYFVQGFGDPASGLLAQPVRAMLREWGEGPAAIGVFMALMSWPWTAKPLFALLADCVPLAGSHRRHYLLTSSALAALALAVLALLPLPRGALPLLFALLLVPAVAIAFGDVLVDALMVEYGQPRGLTGQLQSLQWAAVYTAMIVSGVLAGWLAAHDATAVAFALAASLWAMGWWLAGRHARDLPQTPAAPREVLAGLAACARDPVLRAAAGFLVLWSFNPAWDTVQYLHVTGAQGFGEQAYGLASSAFAAGAVVASLAYGVYCRRLALGRLLDLAVLGGVVGYGLYLDVATPEGFAIVAAIAGFATMTGTLVQLDLCARLVPVRLAASAFAMLMALTNFSASVAEALGAQAYEWLGAAFDADTAYQLVVLAGVCAAAACRALVPTLRRAGDAAPA